MSRIQFVSLCMFLSACNSEAAALGDAASNAAVPSLGEEVIEKPAPLNVTSPSPMSLAAQALENQLSCRTLPEAAIAIRAMLKNKIIREIEGGGDGSVVFQPTASMRVFDLPVVSVTGWQMDDNGAMKPFYRGPGTAPPNFISVSVRATMDEAKAAVLRRGFREEDYVEDHTPGAPTPYRRISGVSFEEGEAFEDAPGVVTLTCRRGHPGERNP
ncbi:hypothetical protein ABIE62_001117 [Porphyrobacter sp. MBR-155]|uniref:hypothetical protein n=1 Tax=Porphyrobacter sp. MBR-155 TaxID=3156464 RepID=UPI00339267B2